MPQSFNNLLPQPGDGLRILEAKILLALKNLGSGGGTTVCITGGVGPPGALAIPCAFSVYVQQPGPNFGLWLGDQSTGVWGNVVVQGP